MREMWSRKTGPKSDRQSLETADDNFRFERRSGKTYGMSRPGKTHGDRRDSVVE